MKLTHYITLVFSLLLLSCMGNQSKSKEDQECLLQIVDIYGQELNLSQYPQTIVSLSPGITELIYELNSGYKLIGRTDYCKHPFDSIKHIESVGGINNASIEKIISLNPDLVITSSIFTKSMSESIQGAGIPILSLPEKPQIEGLYETLTTLGEILDQRAEAEEIISDFKDRLSQLKTSQPTYKQPPKVYYVIQFGAGGDYTAGENTYIDEIITLSGGENIAKSTTNWSFSKEELFANQPDYIFLRHEDSAQFVTTHPYNNLHAVKNSQVYGIESSWVDIQSSRTLKAIEFISGVIN